MSKTHYIQTNLEFSIDSFIQHIAEEIEHVEYQKRADNLCYLWFSEASTRGVDITIEENELIEIRNTIMSNGADYYLTNILADAICTVYDGTLLTIDDDYEYTNYELDDDVLKLMAKELPVYTDEQIEKSVFDDTKTLKAIINSQKTTMTVFGPIRTTHFGVEFMNSFEDKSIEGLTKIMHKYIQAVNYNIPNYSYGNVMTTGEGENQKTLKLLTNQVDCLIDKYDYILFQIDEETIYAITNDDLNSILPKQWTRVDEYTIVAPKLNIVEWKNLLQRVYPLNKFNEI
ncbi:hypothetical protein G6N05_02760 [Flavobacterium sp. F372]|jgi:hypothetical protein|uniref:Uncharacterized protein n=1 Tax=Flavobacterium bernardetii TaxID=2813823 RepID=A0ABR7IVH3_9FLAO|nr:hypothetical protein [Flavobacterium bernardetii]MBC5833796.1 hypothetical protein [Flavobacterium bernardetii]NHF69029.1 hypothetical protein [Flavobacterium bernardetii]